MNQQIRLSSSRLTEFCRKWGIRHLEVFGSALRADFNAASDVDFLASFSAGKKPRWPAILDMREELATIVGRRVDLIDRHLVESSHNYIKRAHILGSAETVYVER